MSETITPTMRREFKDALASSASNPSETLTDDERALLSLIVIPTEIQEQMGPANCERVLRSVAGALLAVRSNAARDFLAGLGPIEIEGAAEKIAMYGTSHFGDDTPFAQQPQMQRAMRYGEAHAVIKYLKQLASPAEQKG